MTLVDRFEALKDHPRLRWDQMGYMLKDESIDGFADRKDLSRADRALLARWADMFTPDAVSKYQRRLLETYDFTPSELVVDTLRGFAKDGSDTSRAFVGGLYDELSKQQLDWLRDPAVHPRMRDRTYPLTIGDMRTLTGASERQLRYWADKGLIPSHRVRGQRRFFSAALVTGFVLAKADRYQKATIATLAEGGRQSEFLVRLIASTLESAVAPKLSPKAQAELEAAAKTLVEHSGEIGGKKLSGQKRRRRSSRKPKPKRARQAA